MLAMAEKMEALLAAAPDPLSFVVIVPAWTEVPAWKALTASRFRQAEVWHRPSSSAEWNTKAMSLEHEPASEPLHVSVK